MELGRRNLKPYVLNVALVITYVILINSAEHSLDSMNTQEANGAWTISKFYNLCKVLEIIKIMLDSELCMGAFNQLSERLSSVQTARARKYVPP